ncbi:MAG: glycosyltransferase family 39 protein [Anaerolineales bacterium]|nr:glycosyltransferase family 39 protein [Anaerolineales bacterium]
MINSIEEKLNRRGIQYLILAAITLLAALLRFYKLGEWSFWYDEIFTLRDVARIFELSATNQQFSRWLIYGAVNLLGTTEFNARLVPALVGMLSIPILYFPTRKMFGPPTALLFAVFLAVSPWHLYWSQNARFYTTLLLFYTLGLFLVYFAFEEDKPWYLIFALLLFGLAVMERLFGVMLVPVIAGYLITLRLLPFEKPPGFRARNIWILVIPTVLIGLVGSYQFISNPEKWLEGFGWINNNPIWIIAGITFYIGIPFICMGLVTAVYFLLSKSRGVLLLTFGAILPAVAIVLLSIFQYSANRYVFVTLTAWLILSALGVWELFKQSKGRTWVIVSGVLLILLVFPMSENVLYYQYQNGNRDDWKSAFALVDELKKPGDMVIATEQGMGDYYLDEDITYHYSSLDYDNLPDTDNRYWFIVDNNLGDKYPELLRWVTGNSDLIANYDVNVRARNFQMRIYLYDPVVP